MQRFITAIFATAITVATASAGTITPSITNPLVQYEIGGTNGLTNSYITTTGDGSTGGYVERGYNSRLFAMATEGATAPTIPTSFTDTGSGHTTDGTSGTPGIKFAAISDGNGGGGFPNNFWDACGAITCTTGTTITVPIGIYDPASVWTMLNNIWGSTGTAPPSQTSVTFDFANPAASYAASSLTINLVNAFNNGATGGQIESAIDCSGPSSNTCTTYAGALNSALAGSSSLTPVGGGTAITVLTDSVFNSPYNTITGGSKYAGSNGTLYLDDQGFIFTGTPYASDYLVDVKITEASGVGNFSQTALSAVTVVAPAVPEPSTVLLLLAGFGAIGASRLRRRAS